MVFHHPQFYTSTEQAQSFRSGGSPSFHNPPPTSSRAMPNYRAGFKNPLSALLLERFESIGNAEHQRGSVNTSNSFR
jgi:hypothetical protein